MRDDPVRMAREYIVPVWGERCAAVEPKREVAGVESPYAMGAEVGGTDCWRGSVAMSVGEEDVD